MREKIYISGAISGLPRQDVEKKFNDAELLLLARGYEVVSPLKKGIPYDAPWEVHVAIDILLLISCDSMYLLPDWKYSKGATLEKNIAELLGKNMIYEETTVFVELKQAISEVMGIPFYDITGGSRKRNIVFARMIYSHLCNKQGESITNIATEMKHDHSTILYYLKKYSEDYKYNKKFREVADEVNNKLNSKEI